MTPARWVAARRPHSGGTGRLYYFKRSPRLWGAAGAGISCAVSAADGWFTFDGRPSC